MINLDEIKFKDGKRHQAGMTVPEGFFVQFEQNLQKEIDKIEPVKLNLSAEKPALSIAPARRINPFVRWISVAACACMVVSVGLFALYFDNEPTADSISSELVAENASEGEFSEDDQLILSSFDDLYLYDLYCDTNY